MTPNKHVGSNWLHLKSNKKVVIVGHGMLEATARPCFFYNEEGENVIWARDSEEFLDGRFQQLSYQVVLFSEAGIMIALVKCGVPLSDLVKEHPEVMRITDQEGTELWTREQPVPQ
ncbi:MAG: hypothetical protein CGW95_00965 [Phenylobacterium zucineum]|nr:MAG: hypothetical protein CGW95_00965 [Phenylobacterium zucineum]